MAVPPVVVTVMVPVLPPAGAVTTNVPPAADVTTAVAPLNLTVFPEADVLKLEPLIVTETPDTPEEGDIVFITGAGTGLFFLQPVKVTKAIKTIKSE